MVNWALLIEQMHMDGSPNYGKCKYYHKATKTKQHHKKTIFWSRSSSTIHKVLEFIGNQKRNVKNQYYFVLFYCGELGLVHIFS